jgi:hypothetical protein
MTIVLNSSLFRVVQLGTAVLAFGLSSSTFAATASFGPMPAIPTSEQCHIMQLADNRVVGAFLHVSQAEEESQFGNTYNGDRIRFQNRYIA